MTWNQSKINLVNEERLNETGGQIFVKKTGNSVIDYEKEK
jgi:hypothetical protein